jgi:pilus assembly protein CpaF
MEGPTITLQDLFAFKPSGYDAEGRVQGKYRPSGLRPTFSEFLAVQGCQLDPAMFLAGAER